MPNESKIVLFAIVMDKRAADSMPKDLLVSYALECQTHGEVGGHHICSIVGWVGYKSCY